jgi:hypothetical protein
MITQRAAAFVNTTGPAAQVALDLFTRDEPPAAVLYPSEPAIGAHAVDPFSITPERLRGLFGREQIRP